MRLYDCEFKSLAFSQPPESSQPPPIKTQCRPNQHLFSIFTFYFPPNMFPPKTPLRDVTHLYANPCNRPTNEDLNPPHKPSKQFLSSTDDASQIFPQTSSTMRTPSTTHYHRIFSTQSTPIRSPNKRSSRNQFAPEPFAENVDLENSNAIYACSSSGSSSSARSSPSTATTSPINKPTRPVSLGNSSFHSSVFNPGWYSVHPVHALFQRQICQWGRQSVVSISPRMMIKDFISRENDIYRLYNDDQFGGPQLSCAFNNVDNSGQFLAATDEEGHVTILNTEHDRSDPAFLRTQWVAHENAVFDLAWSPDDKTIITASGDQTARLWDVETETRLAVFVGHACSIKSITFDPMDPKIFATGARDGNILIWDVRCTGVAVPQGDYVHRAADAIRKAHSGSPLETPIRKRRKRVGSLTPGRNASSQSVTAVKFLEHRPRLLASAGAANGIIKYWDTRSHGSFAFKDVPIPSETSSPSGTSKRPHGIASLSLDSRGARLFAASTDNHIYMYNAYNLGESARKFTSPGYECSSFYIRTSVSPDDRFIASGSTDKRLHVWEIDAPPGNLRNAIALKGHGREVTSVSWSRWRLDRLASCSDDSTVRVWNADRVMADRVRTAKLNREDNTTGSQNDPNIDLDVYGFADAEEKAG